MLPKKQHRAKQLLLQWPNILLSFDFNVLNAEKNNVKHAKLLHSTLASLVNSSHNTNWKSKIYFYLENVDTAEKFSQKDIWVKQESVH